MTELTSTESHVVRATDMAPVTKQLQGRIQEFLIGGGQNLDSEKHYRNFFQISGKIEWLSIKKQVNQLSNNRRSCRCENFRLKQVVKKKKKRLGKGGSGPPTLPLDPPLN